MNVPPYAASLGWYGCWFQLRMAGMTDDEAIADANRQCNIKGKAFARTSVGNADFPLVLSVAVDGGSSRLKRQGAEKNVKLSLHGNWPHTHLGGLEALYGRSPYYQHVIPGLREIYTNLPATLKDLNLSVHRWLTSFLQTDLGLLPSSDSGFLQPDSVQTGIDLGVMDKVVRRGEEIAAMLSDDLSVIDALMRFGPETNLVLLGYHPVALTSLGPISSAGHQSSVLTS